MAKLFFVRAWPKFWNYVLGYFPFRHITLGMTER